MIRLDHQSPRGIRQAVERIGTSDELDDLQVCIAVCRDDDIPAFRAGVDLEAEAAVMHRPADAVVRTLRSTGDFGRLVGEGGRC